MLVEEVRDLINFCCDPPCGDGEYCGCRKDAEKATDLIRAETLEEAARVADTFPHWTPVEGLGKMPSGRDEIAAAIRTLKETA